MTRSQKNAAVISFIAMLTAGWWIPRGLLSYYVWTNNLESGQSACIRKGNIPITATIYQAAYRVIPSEVTYIIAAQFPPFWCAFKHFKQSASPTISSIEAGSDKISLIWRSFAPKGCTRRLVQEWPMSIWGLGTPAPFRDLGKCDDVSIDFTGDTHFERDFQLQKDTLKRVDLDWDIPSCSGVGVNVYTRSNELVVISAIIKMSQRTVCRNFYVESNKLALVVQKTYARFDEYGQELATPKYESMTKYFFSEHDGGNRLGGVSSIDTSEDELHAQFNELRKIIKKTSCQIGPDS